MSDEQKPPKLLGHRMAFDHSRLALQIAATSGIALIPFVFVSFAMP